jgi:hypothetical protein
MKALWKTVAALAIGTSAFSAASTPAGADWWYRGGSGPGFAAGMATGLFALGVAGMAARNQAYYNGACYFGPLECHDYPPPCYSDPYGNPICPPPVQRCFHRQYCYQP